MRFNRDVEFLSPSQQRCLMRQKTTTDLEQPEGIITPLQQLPERWLVLSSYGLIDGLKRLDSGRESAGLDNANEWAVEAHASLEERGVRGYSLASLERGGGVHRVESIERERHNRTFCESNKDSPKEGRKRTDLLERPGADTPRGYRLALPRGGQGP